MKYVTHAAAVLVIAAFTFQSAAFASEAAPKPHVRGTITAVTKTSITVATATGKIDVPVSAATEVVGVVPATESEITDGTFIGTANVEGSGTARALEVVVFPKAMAGTGEGDYPWDLPAGGKKTSTMTNGTVAAPRHSMMTNATVKSVSGNAMKTVTLDYKGGTKTVAIPSNAPIVRVVPATSALLARGAHVVVFPGAGRAPAPFVVVGEKGVTPPM